MPPIGSLSSSRIFSRGSSGGEVTQLQQRLNQAGFDAGGADGSFGPKTRAAVMAFQRANGLLVDGEAGPDTLAALARVTGAQLTGGPTGDSISDLTSGASGRAVRLLQQALTSSGFDPGGVDAQFGPQTDAAVRRFQASRGLPVDGLVGPQTWAALRGNHTTFTAVAATAPARVAGTVDSAELRQRMLAIAQGEVGTAERSNRNDGAILKYPNAFGRGSEPWCADFVSWVSTQAGRPMDASYVPSVKSTLVAEGRWKGQHNPQPGDLVIFDWSGSRSGDHIGILKSVHGDGTITTIEGNTSNPNTGREGVYERRRHMSMVLGFGNPA